MSERSLNIAVDCDDVLVPTAENTVEWYNSEFGTNLDVARFYSGNASDWGVDTIRMASQRVEEFHRSFFDTPPTSYPEAVVAVQSLARRHKQSLLTGRADFLLPVTEAMVDTHFPGCFQRIIHTNHFGDKPRSKGDVCKEFSFNILIDDGLMHCESGVEEGDIEAALLIDRPWNQSRELHPRITRCEDWDVVLDEVAKIARR